MHRALRIEEIITSIVKQVKNTRAPWGRDKRTLVAFALTCTTFTEFALDVVWKDAPMWHLAQRMKEELWEIVKDNQRSDVTYKLQLSVEPNVVREIGFGNRFVFYAKRIQELSLCFEEHGSVDPAILLLWATTEDLLPRYRKLSLNGDFYVWPPSAALLDALLRPSVLTNLQIDVDASEQQPIPFANNQSTLVQSCVYLEVLDLTFGNMFASPKLLLNQWTELLSTMLASTTHLRVFITNLPICSKDVINLAKGQSLFELILTEAINLPAGALSLPSGAFKHLGVLSLRDSSPTAELMRGILSFEPNGILYKCSLRIEPSITPAFSDILALIRGIARHTTLRELTLQFHLDDSLPVTIEESAEFHSALHTLTVLHFVRVYFKRRSLHLDTVMVTHLLNACPKLETWIFFDGLGSHHMGPRRCIIQFEDFIAILQRHAQIRRIPISVDVAKLPSVDSLANFRPHPHYCDLVVENTMDTENLRLIIGTIFPQAHTVQILQPDGQYLSVSMKT